MNKQELETKIQRVRERSPETYNEVLHVVVPFYMFNQKLHRGTAKIQEEKYNINSSELDVMRCLLMSSNPDNVLSPTKIYEKLIFTSGAITKVLKKLEDKGYIVRINNQYDKRSSLVQLTPIGYEVCKNTLIDVFAFEEECFSKLTKEEIKIYEDLTLKLLS
jgi:DNA-binding MarR family transcriptional regulator